MRCSLARVYVWNIWYLYVHCMRNDVPILYKFSSKRSALCILLLWSWSSQTSVHSPAFQLLELYFPLTLLLYSKTERTLRHLARYLYKSVNRREVIMSWYVAYNYAKMFTMDLSLCSCLVLSIPFVVVVFCTWSLTSSISVQRDGW